MAAMQILNDFNECYSILYTDDFPYGCTPNDVIIIIWATPYTKKSREGFRVKKNCMSMLIRKHKLN